MYLLTENFITPFSWTAIIKLGNLEIQIAS